MSMTLLATATNASDTQLVTISNIPGGYSGLLCVRNASLLYSNGAYRLNEDSGAFYSVQTMSSYNGNATVRHDTSWANQWFDEGPGDGCQVLYLPGYSRTNMHKVGIFYGGGQGFGSTVVVGLYNKTAAITSVSFVGYVGTFIAGGLFSVYGLE